MNSDMYSYNNIVEKDEPLHKQVIDCALNDPLPEPTPTMRQLTPTADCIVVDNFLSHEECDQLVEACEKVGYSFWRQHHHEERDGEEKCDDGAKAVRVVDTIEARLPQLSQKLSERINNAVHLHTKHFTRDMPHAEQLYQRDLEGTWVPHALSENLLFGKYRAGGHFMPHIDGSTIQDLNTRSFYTLLIYLNDCPAGGETYIFSGDQCDVTFHDADTNKYRGNTANRIGAVAPTKGSAAFFYYDLLHEGSPVQQGLKYICRADLMYRRTPPILTEENDIKAFQLYEEARVLESSGEAMRACELFQRIGKLSPGVAELYQLD